MAFIKKCISNLIENKKSFSEYRFDTMTNEEISNFLKKLNVHRLKFLRYDRNDESLVLYLDENAQTDLVELNRSLKVLKASKIFITLGKPKTLGGKNVVLFYVAF